jgi:hypothetical protein
LDIAPRPLKRAVAGFAVHALIGHFSQPLPRLAIHIIKIGELSQRPEVLAQICTSGGVYGSV